MIPGIGHNNGPSMEAGFTARRLLWKKARNDLIANLPIEVLRTRVRRAQELGLPYRTYASIRAGSGHDVIGFLFSSNALRLMRDGDSVPPDRAVRLTAIEGAARIAVVHPPVAPGRVAHPPIDAAHEAPRPWAAWAEVRGHVGGIVRLHGLARDGIVVVGDMDAERDWCEAARLAGYLPAHCVFDPAAAAG